MPRDKGLIAIRAWFEGLDKLSYKGLDRHGLSIIYITAFLRPKAKVDKSTNLHIYNMGISPMHKREGLSSLSQYVRRFQTTVYRRHTHIPSSKQTISSGYKVWMIWPNRRFEGLMV